MTSTLRFVVRVMRRLPASYASSPPDQWWAGRTREARCLVVQSALADYRQQFVDELEKIAGDRLRFLTGEVHFEPSLRTGVSSPLVRPGARNVYLFGRRLSWQRHVIRAGIAAPITVQEFNPRILSTWVTLVARRLLGRPTVIWGHAWSRSGHDSRSEPVRRTMRRLSDSVIVYTERQRAELAQHRPTRPVYAAPNAIYTAAVMRSGTVRPDHVLWIGRMVCAKKPQLAVEGFARAAARLPERTRLLMVGDGPLRAAAERSAHELGVEHRVDFVGHVRDVGRLSELFDSALVSVSTGYVGLSLTQSLSFGVPMLYADDEPHAPEIEAATTENSRTFRSADADDLALQLIGFFDNRSVWVSTRAALADDCRRRYSADAMAQSFVAAVAATATARMRAH